LALDIHVMERIPTPEEYEQLRQAVGWRLHDLEDARRGLPGTLFAVCAYADGILAGMARVIGDGALVYYIQDVIVLPAFQGMGIGSRLMDKVMEYIEAHASHNAVVGLMAAKGVEPFYLTYGFASRPNDTLGAGMTIFWKKEGPADSAG
jgi:GNAT superfamily N-acetyltransferase